MFLMKLDIRLLIISVLLKMYIVSIFFLFNSIHQSLDQARSYRNTNYGSACTVQTC